MLDAIITSQTRIKLLLKFFLNNKTQSHLRGLESEFGESTNGIRIELNRLEAANLLSSHREGKKKLYSANKTHPLYNEIHNIVIKQTGLDKLIETVIDRMGSLTCVYLIGDLARGIDSKEIDLIIIGEDIDGDYLARKIAQCENLIGRKISYKLFRIEEANQYLLDVKPDELLLLWDSDERQTSNNKRLKVEGTA